VQCKKRVYHYVASVPPLCPTTAQAEALMSGAPLLEVHGLKRSFGDRAIIHGISFTVHASDILFVRGASGVGKSLLLRALAYLDPIQARSSLLLSPVPVVQRPHVALPSKVPGCSGLLAATR